MNSLEKLDSDSQKFLKETREAIKGVEPGAEIYLFGSRARGDHKPDSDWDLLVLLDNNNSKNRENIIVVLTNLELKFSQIFNVVFYNKKFWDKNSILGSSPFKKNVINDKVVL
jgi:predicted nucleotidyltransferase